MTLVVNNRSYNNEQVRFTNLLNSIQEFLKAAGSNLLVRSTKLGKYEKELKTIDELDAIDAAGLIEIVSRYNQLDVLFFENSKITFKHTDLHKILEGSPILHDNKQNYNDIFFELSIAARYAASFDSTVSIDMTSICDVIVDSAVAIECKYLHGENGLRTNVTKGLDQLDDRVKAGLAKFGFVAIDISALLDKKKIFEFAQGVFECFLSSNEKLCEIGRIEQEEILATIANDKNFSSIITGFAAHQAELAFFSNFGNSEINKMSDNCLAIIYQYNNALCFDDNFNGRLPIPFRGMSYFINPRIVGELRKKIEKYIHNMASGI